MKRVNKATVAWWVAVAVLGGLCLVPVVRADIDPMGRDDGFNDPSVYCHFHGEPRSCGDISIVDGKDVFFTPTSVLESSKLCCPQWDAVDINPAHIAKTTFDECSDPGNVTVTLNLKVKPGAVLTNPNQQYFTPAPGLKFPPGFAQDLYHCGDGTAFVSYFMVGNGAAGCQLAHDIGYAMNDWHDNRTRTAIYIGTFNNAFLESAHNGCPQVYSATFYHWEGHDGYPYRLMMHGTGITNGNHGGGDGDLGKGDGTALPVKASPWGQIKSLWK